MGDALAAREGEEEKMDEHLMARHDELQKALDQIEEIVASTKARAQEVCQYGDCTQPCHTDLDMCPLGIPLCDDHLKIEGIMWRAADTPEARKQWLADLLFSCRHDDLTPLNWSDMGDALARKGGEE